jgi:2-amino-4-hydroxy-6-hydroxymethyldihydropteridine diphosphokinase
MSASHRVFLSLGSNLGDRLAHLGAALERLSANGSVVAKSSVWETVAWGYDDDRPYLNMACEYHTGLDVFALLQSIKDIEREMGRLYLHREGENYSAREIDIDILFYADKILESALLTIPHPRLELRNFVLQPMNEIAPSLHHPLTGKSVSQLLKESPDDNFGSKLSHGL